MSDKIVTFPGTNKKKDDRITVEEVIEAVDNRYDEVILIGRSKRDGKYECVSTLDVAESLFHISRVQHSLHLVLDGNKK